MITRLELLLRSDTKVRYSDGSYFQGYLMSLLDKDYAEFLHTNSLNPYSQRVFYDSERECNVWQISTLTKDAKEYIISPILEGNQKTIHIEGTDTVFQILSKGITVETDYQKISDKYFLGEDAKRYINIQTLTPVTFKSGGMYQNFPDIKSLYVSLYNKWNMFNESVSLEDEDTLAHLVEHTILDRYNLHSANFSTDGVKIKCFVGNMTYYIKGPVPLVNIANMLYDFAQYAGLGAKTGMGMGGISIE